MADLFISYSRTDAGFAARLRDALRSRGCNAWLDVTELRPAERWRDTIRAEIDRADAIVVVLSPDWLASVECAKELQRATEQKKRMVPLVRRDVDVRTVPDAIAGLNWLYFRDGDQFDPGLDKLVDAATTDLEAIKVQTRLLVRAVEWSDHGHDTSYTLRGADLRLAEAWLERPSGSGLPPTDLQVQYVLASRKAVARRQQVTVAAVAIGALVAVALSLVAYFQSQQRARQERIAGARESINEANTLRDLPDAPNRLHDSVRSAIRAVREFGAVGMPSADADESLRRTVALLPEMPRTFATREGSITAAALDRSGHLLGIAYASNQILVWDVAGQRQMKTWTHGLPAGSRRLAIDIAVQPGYLATLAYDSAPGVHASTVTIWRIHDAAVVAEFTRPGRADTVRLSPSGHQVYSRSDVNVWLGWSVTTGEELKPAADDKIVYGLDFSPDGASIAVGYRIRKSTGAYFVDLLDSATLVRHGGWFESDRIRLLRWTRDPAMVLVVTESLAVLRAAASGGPIRSYRRSGEGLAQTPDRQIGRDASLALSPDGTLMAENNAYGAVRVHRVATGAEYRRLIDVREVVTIAFAADGRSLVTLGTDGVISQWDLTEHHAVIEVRHDESITAVEFAPDSNVLLTTSEAGARRGWRLPASLDAIKRPVTPAGVPAVQPMAAPRSVRTSSEGRHVTVFAPDGSVRARVEFAEPITAVAVSHDSRTLAVLMAARTRGRSPVQLEVWSLDPQARLASIPTPEFASWLIFSADDQRIITRGDEGFVFRAAPNLAPQGRIYHARPNLFAVQPAGTRVATTGGDGNIRVWEREVAGPGVEIARIAGVEGLTALALSANGRWLAGVTERGTAQVWPVRGDDLVSLACLRLPHGCDDNPR